MARRLAPGVWLLELGLIEPLDSWAYLVDDGELTLVDAGLFLNSPSIATELAALGYGVDGIDRVLITHYDLDHVGGLRTIDFDGPVYVGSRDLALLAGEEAPTLRHPKGIFHRVARRLWPLSEVDLRPVEDGDRIGGFTAFHTPGHNPGHTAYVHADLGVAFLGDLVWGEGGALTTPIWWDSYDMAELAESVRDLAARAPPFEVAAMGHGEPLTAGGSAALADLAASL
jgi:glyoxylase-like metal-dependent hydrolase (beta-lactamase superfamily II)